MDSAITQLRVFVFGAIAAFILVGLPNNASSQVTAFKQAIAEAAATDADIASFYKGVAYQSLWTGASDLEQQRRIELFTALSRAVNHGLPIAQYDVVGLRAQMKAANSPRERGLVEVEISRTFLQYVRDIQTGVLVPSRVDKAIARQVPYKDRTSSLINFSVSSPSDFFKALAPETFEYTSLMSEKLRLERVLADGGWGPKVSAEVLKPGQAGPQVAAMRDRLVAMGFLMRTNGQNYDAKMQSAVEKFQTAHGLAADGVAGASTIGEINKGVETRLKSIIVSMERERWMEKTRGNRHVLVNIPDFTAKIIDSGKVTFSTRSVVGAFRTGRLTPEFSDVMEFLIINPSWHVPRSIMTKEYLPQLQDDPNAVSHIEITDRRGQRVDRSVVDFTQFTSKDFPFAMRQPPSKGNALGLVKFMFPNRHNIYLHDTPQKSLFAREVRAFSHGCVRLGDPFDFAYAILAKQEGNPKDFFQKLLSTRKETRVDLISPVPVHIVYRTAFINDKGQAQYRRDIYGRNDRIWKALVEEGVVLSSLQG